MGNWERAMGNCESEIGIIIYTWFLQFIPHSLFPIHNSLFPIHYYLAALIISANTPLAVTSAPAPAPFITSGCSL